jgi:hypothetical protein
MKALLLGACLAAVLSAPALAQPYGDDQGGGYQDQRDPYYDQDQGQAQGQDQDDRSQDDRGYQDNRGYGGDSGYGERRYDDDRSNDNDRYDDDRYNGAGQYNDDRYGGDGRYDRDQAYSRYGRQDWRAEAGVPPGARLTGRTGASWRNAEGQTCTWRELSWTDHNGGAASRWIQRCQD